MAIDLQQLQAIFGLLDRFGPEADLRRQAMEQALQLNQGEFELRQQGFDLSSMMAELQRQQMEQDIAQRAPLVGMADQIAQMTLQEGEAGLAAQEAQRRSMEANSLAALMPFLSGFEGFPSPAEQYGFNPVDIIQRAMPGLEPTGMGSVGQQAPQASPEVQAIMQAFLNQGQQQQAPEQGQSQPKAKKVQLPEPWLWNPFIPMADWAFNR